MVKSSQVKSSNKCRFAAVTIISCSMFCLSARAQFTTPSAGNTHTTDNVGVGTTPYSGFKFSVLGNSQINGDLSLTKPSPSTWRNIKAYSSSGALQLAANSGSNDGGAIEMYGNASSGKEGEIRMISNGSGASGGIHFMNYNPASGGSWITNMRILSNGQVYIGNVKPNGLFAAYKLGVDGDIVCKRMVVQTASWADFVFAPDYKLPTLAEVEQYIVANKHLPNVPTTTQVTEKGIDVGEMNKILLQKVEELTLYMIELKNENEAIKSAITHLQK